MTARKTYSLPDELASALEREATNQGRSASAVVRDAFAMYLSSQKRSALSTWVGAGASSGEVGPLDHDALHDEIVAVLDRKHPSTPAKPRRRKRP